MDKPDVAALIALLHELAATLQSPNETLQDAFHHTRWMLTQAAAALQSQQARVAELEAALRGITDPAIRATIAARKP